MSQGLIQGSMREAPLPDIIQLVSQSGKSGCFHVLDEPKRAKIFMKDGKLIHAVTNDAQGLDALYDVALWLDGSYHFEEGSPDITPSITKSNAAVLMEMHRRMEEWRVISQKITSLDLYPISTLLPGEQLHGVNPRQAKLLALISGWFTVAELAEVMQKPVLTLAKDLYDLVMTGQVTLKGVRSGKNPLWRLNQPLQCLRLRSHHRFCRRKVLFPRVSLSSPRALPPSLWLLRSQPLHRDLWVYQLRWSLQAFQNCRSRLKLRLGLRLAGRSRIL